MFNSFKKTGKESSCCHVKIEEVKEEKTDCCKEPEQPVCCSAEKN
ncbi:hypothetical protein [Neobacillus notoginsengisoli]|nr:hypothetical protein [Neobacillus notoginsengisoli]